MIVDLTQRNAMNLRLEYNLLAKLNQLNGENETCSDLCDEWVCVRHSLLTYVTHFVCVCVVYLDRSHCLKWSNNREIGH